MTRNRVFLAAVMAVASLGAVAQSNSAGAQTPVQSNQTSVQQRSSANEGSVSRASGNSVSAQAEKPRAEQPRDDAAARSQSSKADEATAINGQLPQTSTILPLLGLIGLGSLVAGFFARR